MIKTKRDELLDAQQEIEENLKNALEDLSEHVYEDSQKFFEKTFNITLLKNALDAVTLQLEQLNDDGEIKHESGKKYRFKDNPMEKKFASAWKEENTVRPGSRRDPMLAMLIGNGIHPAEITDRDAFIAASVVQWFGSPVGRNWLGEILGITIGYKGEIETNESKTKLKRRVKV